MREIALERFLAARRTWLEAGKYRFQIQRPTMLDIVKAGQGETQLSIEFAAGFVIGWEGVTELDLIPGGDPEPAAFIPEVFVAWVAERPDLWRAIATGIATAYATHEERTEARGNV